MASPRLITGRNSQLGAHYVVTTVTSNRDPLFGQSQVAGAAATEIARCEEEERVASLAWVIMPDHVHWLLELKQGSLSRCLQAFKSRLARAVNAEILGGGSIWQPGFYDHRIREDEDLLEQARYLVANPIRSGLVSRIEDYPHWWCQWVQRTEDL
ncbi:MULTISPECIES: transposase [unclassified Pseudoxanthomonas]|uniref:REP-associated tyrosine transposase n=1 Tax=unclassified Pseudoxanthomonas TaxID=2645906 RepID=UPI0030778AEE